MSAGRFERLGYNDNAGNLFFCLVQPETATFTAGGVANTDIPGPIPPATRRALVSVGKRRRGVKIARSVGFRFNVGGAPAGYKEDSVYYLPWFNPTTFATINEGAPVAYLGGTGVVVGESAERGR